MPLARSLQPRDAQRAGRTAAGLLVVSALITLVFGLVIPVPGPAGQVITLVVPVVLLAVAVTVRRLPEHLVGSVTLLVAAAGVVTTAALNLATQDASAAAQIFFVIPGLYAATQVRALGASVVVALAVAGHCLVVFTLLPPAQAAMDAVYVATLLVTTTWLLVRSGDTQERLVALLRAQASVDPLTGLSTRRVLDEAIGAALSAGHCEGTALVLVDVDAFKAVNDTWGHPVGDDALTLVAQCLRSSSRPGDVLCRLGGDEFALLLPGWSPAAARERAAEVVLAVTGRPLQLSGGSALVLSISAGVGHEGSGSQDRRRLYAEADADLYRAKRGRVRGGRRAAADGVPAQVSAPVAHREPTA